MKFGLMYEVAYAAVRAPEAFFFGTSDDEKIAQDELSPQRLVERGLLCAPYRSKYLRLRQMCRRVSPRP